MNPIPLLIVEDNPIYAEVLQRLLVTLGTDYQFTISWVDTAEKALELIGRQRFDITLLDYKLPRADGLSVLAGIHNLPVAQQPAVIMLTGMGREEVAVEAMKRGAKDYLSKDHLDVASLLRAITSALERRHLETELARSTQELRERNAQLQADLDMAREIQETLMPQTYPTFPAGVPVEQSALRFHHRYLPATVVGGDFFDVMSLPGRKAGVFISDVVGHGVRAALVTAVLRTLAEELAPLAEDPGVFLAEMNRRLLGLLQRTRTPIFASACYIVADPHAGRLRFALAGHPIPLHVQRSRGVVAQLSVPAGKAGAALGVLADSTYNVFNADLVPNDLILLYTDGLFETRAADGQQYGEPRLLEAVQARAPMQTPELFTDLLTDVQRFSASADFPDDVCLLGMDVVRVGA
jgi:sigma-B regulation protein RsbU (phosphoserine phosphatase)